jgi:hypothetical protein
MRNEPKKYNTVKESDVLSRMKRLSADLDAQAKEGNHLSLIKGIALDHAIEVLENPKGKSNV